MSILQQWNRFEIIWLSSFIVLGILITWLQQDSTLLNLATLISGILCVVLAAKGNILNYYFGIFNSCAYAWICWNNGLYGEMGLNLLFFLPTALIGLYVWNKHSHQHQLVAVKTLTSKMLGMIALLSLAAIGLLGFALAQINSQNHPYIDATTNILSISATLLMMLRFREQWWFYILLNVLTIVLWLLRTLDGSGDGYMMLIMWSAFLINAAYGYYNWSKMAKQQQSDTTIPPQIQMDS